MVRNGLEKKGVVKGLALDLANTEASPWYLNGYQKPYGKTQSIMS
jgi:hypothetical protein